MTSNELIKVLIRASRLGAISIEKLQHVFNCKAGDQCSDRKKTLAALNKRREEFFNR